MSAGAATLVQEKWGPSGGDRDIFKVGRKYVHPLHHWYVRISLISNMEHCSAALFLPAVRSQDFNDATLSIAASALFGEDVRGQEADRINAAISASFEFFAQRSAGLPVPEWCDKSSHRLPTHSALHHRGLHWA